MKKKYIIGVLLGFLIVLLAVPLGNIFGMLFLTMGKNIEKYNIQLERTIVSFQIVGGILSGLSGLAFVFSDKKE